jgi:hypothetical protein
MRLRYSKQRRGTKPTLSSPQLAPISSCTIRGGSRRGLSFVFVFDSFCYLTLDRWDEWVPITRLLKFNDTNVQLQKALMAQASAAASTSGSSSKGKAHGGGMMKDGSSSRGGGLGRKDGRGTKRGREEVRLFFYTNVSWCIFWWR